MKPINYFLMFLFVFLCSCVSHAEEHKLIQILRNETDVNKVYNAIGNIEWSNENLNVINYLWEKDLSKLSDIQRTKLDNDIIRLALANVLMQAKRHCRIDDVNMDELHKFVLSKAKSDNLRISGRATHLLGLAGYKTDIPFLSSIVEMEKKGYAEGAAESIMFIHSEVALEEIRKLSNKVKRPSLKIFLQNIVEKNQKYPLIEYSRGCEGMKSTNRSDHNN